MSLPLVSKTMTFPQLVDTANSHAEKTAILQDQELRYLIALLEAYGEEILKLGQTLQIGSVTLTMAITGQVCATIAGDKE